jgi:Carboxypeptidase regulatory-like domain
VKVLRTFACAAAALLLLAAPLAAQDRPQTATLRLVVQDQTGGVLPGAMVQVKGEDAGTRHVSLADVTADAQGVATVRDLPVGRYAVEVSFPGFATRAVPSVRLRAGDNRRAVTLAIEKLDESVSVARDRATAASDANSDRYGNVLSKEQIAALPDDPDEMERVLEEMAGPGATIRVDGFRGGKLPPKSQIRSIRFASGMFSAENHAGGMTHVDITTAPGLGPLRGSLDIAFRDGALNARNAFQPAKGPEQTQQYTLNLSGTIVKDRTSFSLSAGGASLYDSANVFAATPDGARAVPLRRPSDRVNVTGRLDHGLTSTHALRAMFQQNDTDQRNLGVGSFDLADRAYARTARETMVRLSETGPLTSTLFAETRLQLRRSSTASASASDTPTIRVLDAFTSGGAQQDGGRQATDLELATNVDWALGKHAVRFGALVEGGSYRSDTRTNYLGTYTFASLADFEAGRPSAYTRRLGDPFVQYAHWQAGLFVQDDWRARKNLTLSGGLRYELQTHLGDRWNVAPRAGFAWSPFAGGRTTVRGGGGIFYDWLDAQTYEQTLRVDGLRQQDLVVRNPGYPDPFAGDASQEVLPTSKFLLPPGLVMPTRAMINVGVSQQIRPMFTVNVNYNHTEGRNRFRGRNINAPLAGARPDPAFGTITQVEPTARMRGDTLNVGMNVNVPQRRMFLFANLAWIRQRNDADGTFSLPADSYDVAAEWGPAAGVPNYVASAMFSSPLWRNVRISLSTSLQGGAPYNVTTGRDDNGDTVFNDRPEGVGRNSARGKGSWDVGARVSYAFGFGQRDGNGPQGGPIMIVQRVGPGADSGGMLGAFGGGGAEDKRLRIELFAQAQNLFNHANPIGYSGVMTSPFFGQPTASLPGRRLELGVRIGF